MAPEARARRLLRSTHRKSSSSSPNETNKLIQRPAETRNAQRRHLQPRPATSHPTKRTKMKVSSSHSTRPSCSSSSARWPLQPPRIHHAEQCRAQAARPATPTWKPRLPSMNSAILTVSPRSKPPSAQRLQAIDDDNPMLASAPSSGTSRPASEPTQRQTPPAGTSTPAAPTAQQRPPHRPTKTSAVVLNNERSRFPKRLRSFYPPSANPVPLPTPSRPPQKAFCRPTKAFASHHEGLPKPSATRPHLGAKPQPHLPMRRRKK
jgi:hypothetical protein